jgi:hypothetical protein
LTDIDVVVVGGGRNLKGRLLSFVLATIGKRVLEKAFKNSVRVSKPERRGESGMLSMSMLHAGLAGLTVLSRSACFN